MADAEDTLLELSGLPRRRPGQRLGDLPNPLSVFGRGIDRVTTPGYAVDDALLRWRGEAPIFKATLGEAVKGAGVNLVKPMAAFAGGLRDRDYRAVMESSLLPMAGMTVYHGSPHWFDAFDLKKVGTGEGAQAYGHGLYFAENPGVAKDYQALGEDFVTLNGKKVNPMLTKVSYADGATEAERIAANAFWRFKDKKEAIQSLAGRYHTEAEAEAVKILKSSRDIALGGGTLYHVDIPDDEIAKMLDWDKPLSEQAPEVQKAIRTEFEKRQITPWAEDRQTGKIRDMNGKEIYRELSGRLSIQNPSPLSAEAQASEHLKSLGIPGIKYLDAGSRGKVTAEDVRYLRDQWRAAERKGLAAEAEGYFKDYRAKLKEFQANKPTRNIVLFDEKLARIIKRE